LNGATIVCSETCALDLIDAEYVRDVEPGEIVRIDAEGTNRSGHSQGAAHQCIFEHVYLRDRTAWSSDATCSSRGCPSGGNWAREAPAARRHGRACA